MKLRERGHKLRFTLCSERLWEYVSRRSNKRKRVLRWRSSSTGCYQRKSIFKKWQLSTEMLTLSQKEYFLPMATSILPLDLVGKDMFGEVLTHTPLLFARKSHLLMHLLNFVPSSFIRESEAFLKLLPISLLVPLRATYKYGLWSSKSRNSYQCQDRVTAIE